MIVPKSIVVGVVLIAGVGARYAIPHRDTAIVTLRSATDARPYIKDDGTNLRTCPIGYDWAASQNDWKIDCRVLEWLAPHTHVTMLCWVSTTPPSEGASAKWFKIGGIEEHASDLVGWVWSDNIDAQAQGTPECDHIGHEKDPKPQPVQPPEPTILVSGTCTSASGSLSAATKNYFADEAALPLIGDPGIWDSKSNYVRSIPNALVLRSDGSLIWSWSCAGLSPGHYNVGAQLASNRPTFADFYVGAPPRPEQPEPPPQPQPSIKPTPPPKSTISNFQVIVYDQEPGHVRVSFNLAWQTGRDPITCHFFIDGAERFTKHCGNPSSNQFYGISEGDHSFYATASDKYGVYSDPSPTVTRHVPGQAPPQPKGFHVQDDYLGGTWARTDPNNGTWHSKGNRPPNGKYWFDNGLGIGVDCARSAAAYTVKFANGSTQTWTWWLHVTDNTWIPAAAVHESTADGAQGVPTC